MKRWGVAREPLRTLGNRWGAAWESLRNLVAPQKQSPEIKRTSLNHKICMIHLQRVMYRYKETLSRAILYRLRSKALKSDVRSEIMKRIYYTYSI